MGQAQSSSLDAGSLEPGVKISEGLLLQLSGVEPEPNQGHARSQPALAVKHSSEEDQEAEAFAREDAKLAHALEHSRRVGHALLKADEKELKQIRELADELLASELNVPGRDRPCQDLAAECVRCYEGNLDNPLACAGAVDAYAQCTRKAWHGVIVAA